MSESAPTPPDERLQTVARSRVGGVRVERFEGLRAGEAVAAVRRLGLRPAPERVEGYEPGLHGFVVGQEPAEGGELQTGDEVVLFIAAPSRGRADDDDAPRAGDEMERDGVEAEAGLVEAHDVSVGDGVFPIHADEAVHNEALRVGEPGYADETVEVHELASPTDWPAAFEESLEDHELDRAARRGERRAAAIAGVRSWWRGLPGAVRWVALGVSGCVVLIVVAAISSKGTPPQRSARGLTPAGRPTMIAPPARSAPTTVVATRNGRPMPPAGHCRERERRRERSAPRLRARVVYVSAASTASATSAVSAARGPGAGGLPMDGSGAGGGASSAGGGDGSGGAGESAEARLAREFGGP